MAERPLKTTPQILLVEDDDFLAKMYRRVFENQGWTVEEANDGEVAIKKAKKHPYRLIVLDLLLPHHDGFEVLKKIRSSKVSKNRSTPIVVLSNLSEPEHIQRARTLGIQGYLIKAHLTPKEVVQVLQPYLS